MRTAALFLRAFLLTQAVELPCGLLFGGKRALWPVFLCNMLTNPLMNLLLLLGTWAMGAEAYVPLLAVLEAAVVAGEALLLRAMCGFSLVKALMASLTLNAASFCTGLLLNALLP